MEMAEQERGVDLARASQAGGGACNSVGPQDLQNIRLLIDIGGRTIEIPLKGKLVVQTAGGGDAAADGHSAAAAVAQKREDDQKYLDQMRGWLITVATLFMGIAFQAAIQPPAWVPEDWFESVLRTRFTSAAGEAAITTSRLLSSVILYMLFNAATFTIALLLHLGF